MSEKSETTLAHIGLAAALTGTMLAGGPRWSPRQVAPKKRNPKKAAQRAQRQARKTQRAKA